MLRSRSELADEAEAEAVSSCDERNRTYPRVLARRRHTRALGALYGKERGFERDEQAARLTHAVDARQDAAHDLERRAAVGLTRTAAQVLHGQPGAGEGDAHLGRPRPLLPDERRAES